MHQLGLVTVTNTSILLRWFAQHECECLWSYGRRPVTTRLGYAFSSELPEQTPDGAQELGNIPTPALRPLRPSARCLGSAATSFPSITRALTPPLLLSQTSSATRCSSSATTTAASPSCGCVTGQTTAGMALMRTAAAVSPRQPCPSIPPPSLCCAVVPAAFLGLPQCWFSGWGLTGCFSLPRADHLQHGILPVPGNLRLRAGALALRWGQGLCGRS